MTLRQTIESAAFALVLVVGLPAIIFASQRIAG